MDQWKEKHPIRRFFLYLKGKGWWDDVQDRNLRDKERISVLKVRHLMPFARFSVPAFAFQEYFEVGVYVAHAKEARRALCVFFSVTRALQVCMERPNVRRWFLLSSAADKVRLAYAIPFLDACALETMFAIQCGKATRRRESTVASARVKYARGSLREEHAQA